MTSLDYKTSKHIFHRVVKEFLKDKIRILVSDNTYHFRNANQVLVFSKGSTKIIQNKNTVNEKTGAHEHDKITKGMCLNKADSVKETDDENTRLLENECNPNKKTYEYIHKENNFYGNIKFETFKKYAKLCGGYWTILGVLIFSILSESSTVISNTFLSIW